MSVLLFGTKCHIREALETRDAVDKIEEQLRVARLELQSSKEENAGEVGVLANLRKTSEEFAATFNCSE